ncbi:MAG: OmpA family protein [Spirulinaceae cyanobacterium]
MLLGEDTSPQAPPEATKRPLVEDIQTKLLDELELHEGTSSGVNWNVAESESSSTFNQPETESKSSLNFNQSETERESSPNLNQPETERESSPNLNQPETESESSFVDSYPVESGGKIALTESQILPTTIEPQSTTITAQNSEEQALQQLQMLLFGPDMSNLEGKVRQIEHQLFDPEALMSLLVPIIVDLLDRKVRDSKEEMAHALFPIVDRLILQRSQEDKIAMSQALANVIPEAISQQIRNDPETIIQAIAPMMGGAIAAQLHNDRDTVISALAPAMGRAIKQQMELERDVMVDALYPIVGSTVSRYLGEAIQEINDKVTNTLSIQGIKRQVVAASRGISTAELILQEALPCRVQAVFLVHKASGLTITDVQRLDTLKLEPDMIAGMLTAIRSFVKDCMDNGDQNSGSELNEIEYGDSKILLEVAGYCYLAVILQGDPPRTFLRQIRQTLGNLIQKHGDAIENYDGDPDTVPPTVRSQVQDLLEDFSNKPKPYQGFPWALTGLVAVILGIIAVPAIIFAQNQRFNRQIETAIEGAWYDAADLSVYNLDAKVTGERLILTGRVPNEQLRDRAAMFTEAFQDYRTLDNQIVAVNLPPDPAQTEAEVQRILELVNDQPGVDITAKYEPRFDDKKQLQPGVVAIAGTIERLEDAIAVTQAFNDVPGVGKITNTVKVDITGLDLRLYFGIGSAQLQSTDLSTKIPLIQQQLQQYPNIKLQLIGYSPTDEPNSSLDLAQQRANAVKNALIQRGIEAERLSIVGQVGRPSDVTATAADWLSRCVLLEVKLSPLQP